MPDGLIIRNMTRPEVDELVEWAAREGWNPGLHDADSFWATDPEAFIAAEYDSALIGGGAITSYNGAFGFMGFFIVRPEYRGRGFGNTLWHARRDRLLARLHPGASIGLDGVFEMQDFYAKGGFVFSHRNMRFRAEIPVHYEVIQDDEAIFPLSSVPFDAVQEYDRSCFPVLRPAFLKAWINQPDSLALCCTRNEKLAGYGVVRRCREGCKIGPLFADDVQAAHTLYTRLAAFATGGPLYLDAPENNPAAIELAHQHVMTEVFGCARMYLGQPPVLCTCAYLRRHNLRARLMCGRDLIGYSSHPPHPQWPNKARIAVQFVLNFEEGAESCILNGDACSEAYLHELLGRPYRDGERDLSVESMYEYGSRAGVWRILRLFNDRSLPLTVFAVGRALELTPEIGHALAVAGHEIAGHGYRWIDYRGIPEDEERRHIRLTFEIIEQICGKYPVGWYTGRVSQNTRRLLREEGALLYSSDAYNDDLPYWLDGSPSHLVIPYTLVNNDARYLLPNGFTSGKDFFRSLRDAFDLLWQEGEHCPKMMSIGLHGRISGHPARAMALARFLDYIRNHDSVWICRREEIARHWIAVHQSGVGKCMY